jgi:hypothetical protein
MNEDNRFDPTKEKVIPCFICGKVWTRAEFDQWVYFNGTLVCKSHPGAQKWYDGAVEMMEEKLKIARNP